MAKMNWPKDRREAFLVAAEAFGTPHDERTERQKELTSDGICYAITQLVGPCGIYCWAHDFRINAGMGYNAYWWPDRGFDEGWTPSCDKQRSLFCMFMAVLSDKEFEEIGL